MGELICKEGVYNQVLRVAYIPSITKTQKPILWIFAISVSIAYYRNNYNRQKQSGDTLT